jgi:tetratricopeptide (TPR) repeat protein
MKQPKTPTDLAELHQLLKNDPQGYLRVVNEWIDEDPTDHHAYFSRHFAWMKIGQPEKALDDLNKAIALELKPDPMSFLARGRVHRHLGEYEKAIEDYDRGEAIDPSRWQADAMGVLYQADTHARLGNDAAALACCARLPEDFWTPGPDGTPGGGKADIANKLCQIASEAGRKRTS